MSKETKKNILEWVVDLLAAFILATLLLTIVKPIIIKQSSMEDTFLENDYVIVSAKSYKWFTEPKRGDVIVFESDLKQDNGKDKNLIKRIIALPGEEIEIIDGIVYINGEELNEPYLKEQKISGELEKQIIKENELFVMGDNRRVSLDSREIGPIKEDTIVGRVVLRAFPFKRFSKIERIEY